MKQLALAIFFILSIISPKAQADFPKVKILTKDTKTSIRGLSVVNDVVVWAAGSKGTVGRTTDGGKTWKWMVVKGFEGRDFRDIEAFDGATAIAMAVDTPAYIIKTINGGESWKVVYENRKAGMFLDAMEFWNHQAGIVVGDPIDGKLFIARSFDGGATWKEIPDNHKPRSDSGEAMFAASGTNVRVLDKDEAVFVTGGLSSRLFIRDKATKLPLLQGKETTGANSIAVQDVHSRKGGTTLIIVGGDFNTPDSDSLNCFYSNDRGKTWAAPKIPPHGYRSCVEYLSKKHVIACGINGVDYSVDGGRKWTWISKEGFNVCRIAKNGSAVFLAGNNGKIARLVGPRSKE
ncbi:MAG TPA: oxidoreductase [Flavisolibacter sp.]|nr:oxidoreductase [Flavisolibacter sp.]